MGSTARIFVHEAAPETLDAIERQIQDLESKWSRFRPTSEISWLNARAGEAVSVSPATIGLIRRAVGASQQTQGWFDPSLLNELCEAGYDQDHRFLTPTDSLVVQIDRSAAEPTVSVHEWNSPCAEIRIDPNANTVWFPENLAFDPGGIGKGLAADMAVQFALSMGATSAMVDMGGDIRFGGQAPTGGWPVDLESPFKPGFVIGQFSAQGGAIATSSKAKRRWLANGTVHHHLIDPGTGLPSASDVVSATVIAGECWWAESVAKAALLAGVRRGLQLMDTCEVSGVLIDQAGNAHRSAELCEMAR